MKDSLLNKIANIIIYFLVICLICLITYNIFLLVHSTYYIQSPPKNSIEVGPNL